MSSRRFLDSQGIAKDAKFLHADNGDRSDCADAQADLSLRWAHVSEGMFSGVTANISTHYENTPIQIY